MNLTDHLRCDVPADWMNDFSQCVYEWQGLEGGLLALGAALLGVIFLRRQIQQSDRQERQRLQRQQNAVRATLPLTLSGLVETLRRMLLALAAAAAEVREAGFSSSFDPPPTPTEHIAELQAVIASTDERTVTEPISEIIREIQTLWARVNVLRDRREQKRRVGLRQNIDEWIIQTAQIHALVESLFAYARSEEIRGPISVGWDRAESVLFHLGLETSTLVGTVKRGLEKSPNFWILEE